MRERFNGDYKVLARKYNTTETKTRKNLADLLSKVLSYNLELMIVIRLY
jgi:hypothetical protein